MKKKLFLLLLPLTLTMVSCGKDLDPKVDKVDLVRLLDDAEIAEVYRKINDKFNNSVSAVEVNYSMIEDNLIDQRTETTVSGSVKIKGDEYSETKAEMTSKVKNNFYTYTAKTVTEGKVAAFGDYYVSMTESVKDDQKDAKNTQFEYSEKGDMNIVEASTSLPFTPSSFSDVTFGVDKGNNIYAVYNREAVNTTEGRDKDGKDASFIDKSTYEVYAKLGNLKDPKIESFKTVRLYEANYDEELKIYKNYQTVESTVMSYKFEYKNRGKNDGKEKFINSLPEKYIAGLSVTMNIYAERVGYPYEYVGNQNLVTTAFKGNYSEDLFAFKANEVEFNKDYGYGFDAHYSEIAINKASQTITSTVKAAATTIIYPTNDMYTKTINTDAGSVKAVQLYDETGFISHRVDFVVNPTNGNMSVYII